MKSQRISVAIAGDNPYRLKAACEERMNEEGTYCPPARIINELIRQHLKLPENFQMPANQRPKRAKRVKRKANLTLARSA